MRQGQTSQISRSWSSLSNSLGKLHARINWYQRKTAGIFRGKKIPHEFTTTKKPWITTIIQQPSPPLEATIHHHGDHPIRGSHRPPAAVGRGSRLRGASMTSACRSDSWRTSRQAMERPKVRTRRMRSSSLAGEQGIAVKSVNFTGDQ